MNAPNLQFAISARDEFSPEFSRVQRELMETEGRLDNASRSAQRFDRSLTESGRGSGIRAFRGGVGNIAQQMQDVTVQMQAGTAASIIFAQQGPQIASAFGPVGAVIGAVGAIAVVAGSAFFGFRGEAESLEDRLGDLNDSLDEYRRLTKLAEGDTAAIVAEYGAATAAVRELIDAQQRLKRDEALSEAEAVFRQLTDAFGDLREVQNLSRREMKALGGVVPSELSQITQGVLEISQKFGIAREEAEALQNAIVDASTNESLEEQAEALRRIRGLLEEQRDAQGRLPPEAQALVTEINAAEKAIRLVLHTTDGLPGAFDAAAGAASGMAAEIERAANAASSLRNANLADLTRARIRLEFEGDPVGEAAALAGARFDAEVGDRSGLDPRLRLALEEQRQESVAAAREAAQLEERRREIVQSRRTASRSSGGGRSGGASRISEEERAAERAETSFDHLSESIGEKIEKTREDISLIGIEGEARDRAVTLLEAEKLRREALAEAKASSGRVTEEEIAQVNREIEAYSRLELARISQAAAAERQAEAERKALAEAEALTDEITGPFKEALVSGEASFSSFADAMVDIGRNLASRLIDEAFKPIEDALVSLFSGKSGSGGLGGLLAGIGGSLLGGAAASGTPAWWNTTSSFVPIPGLADVPIPGLADGGVANGLAMVGERGRELVNFGSPSRVFSNADTERMLAGGGGGGPSFNFNVDARGSTMSESQWRKIAREEVQRGTAALIERHREYPVFR